MSNEQKTIQGTRNNEQETRYGENSLKEKMDAFAFGVHKATKTFPKEEIYGLTSQLRRAALSVVLNFIEGYARTGTKEYMNFIRIAYGSLKEAKYLLFFSQREGYLNTETYRELISTSEEIGAMLWSTLKKLKEK